MSKFGPKCDACVDFYQGEWNGDTYPIKEVKAFKVDGEKIKADTFYKLVGGEAVKVGEADL